jgi:hypothetical protein
MRWVGSHTHRAADSNHWDLPPPKVHQKGNNPMQLSTNRAVGSIGLLFTILGAWFFGAGFEQPWSVGHIGTLVFLIFGLALCAYGYGKALFGRK